MSYNDLKHDPDVIKKAWVKVKPKAIITKEACKIVFPKHYLDGTLGSVEENYYVLGIFAIVIGNKYAVSMANASIPLVPENVNVVHHEGQEFVELMFEANSIVCPDYSLFMNSNIVYEIYNEFYGKANVPFYINPVRLSNLFRTAKSLADVNLGGSPALFDVLASTIIRHEDDLGKQYRYFIKKQSDVEVGKYVYISQSSVIHNRSNFLTKVGGAYFNDGLRSSLITTNNRSDPIEQIYRS